MSEPSALLTFLLPGACVAAAAAGWLAWQAPGRRGVAILADTIGGLATACALAAWIARWVEAGHLPLFGTWESGLSLALAMLAAAWVASWLGGGKLRLWAVAGAVAAGVLAHASAYSTAIYALTISERSWVVDLHAVLAWAAFAALGLNAAYGAALLTARDTLQRVQQAAERGLAVSLSLGFVLHSAMMASGSFYKFLLFGEAWSFDPIEILGFIAWIAYATLLHLHLMGGWEGRQLARWSVGLFLLLVLSYRGIVYFPAWSTYHIFDMDLRVHVTGSGAS